MRSGTGGFGKDMLNDSTASSRSSRPVLLTCSLLLAGLLLRIFFLHRYAFIANDGLLYQDIALNWLHQHVYGLSTDAAPRPTLIRLPGYPAILAACAFLFPRWADDTGTMRSFLPVLWLQVAADLLTCWLASLIAGRLLGQRSALLALGLAALCPFTANYCVVPLTETFTLTLLTLSFYLLLRWMDRPAWSTAVLLSMALSAGILLRPDQGLLAAVVLPTMFLVQWRTAGVRFAVLQFAACALLVMLPFVPWTMRNYCTFGVVEPLAPRLANDPGEVPPRAFQHWFRTWAVDFSSTQDAYWNYPDQPVLLSDLPDRAFDSPEQRGRTADLLRRAAQTERLDAQVEQGFSQLAWEREGSHALRTALLPFARLANMLLRPRTEMLPVAERWWQYPLHRSQTVFAWGYATLNLAYFAAAIAGWRRIMSANSVLAWSMLLYFALRCLLLLTLDNAEQRYTLEFFPILCVFASALAGKSDPDNA